VAFIFADETARWARDAHMGFLFTGCRADEEANLEWTDVDFEGRRIIIRPKEFWKPKGLEERTIPMHPELFRLLANKPRISRWVFTKQDGGKLNIHSLETRFRRQLHRLGIKNANLHTWRHTFASYLMMISGNIRAIQKLLGHKSIRTTEIYAHLSDRHLHHVASMLPSPNLVTVLVTPAVFGDRETAQVIDNEGMGDTGFEPVTSTV
jgi:integrase/recombinase XerD